MEQDCDTLRVKVLDQKNLEIMLDIKRSNIEIMELKKSVESLKKSNEVMKVELHKLKASQEDTVPRNIRGKYLKFNSHDYNMYAIIIRQCQHKEKRQIPFEE